MAHQGFIAPSLNSDSMVSAAVNRLGKHLVKKTRSSASDRRPEKSNCIARKFSFVGKYGSLLTSPHGPASNDQEGNMFAFPGR
eukprot:gene21095-27982_t